MTCTIPRNPRVSTRLCAKGQALSQMGMDWKILRKRNREDQSPWPLCRSDRRGSLGQIAGVFASSEGSVGAISAGSSRSVVSHLRWDGPSDKFMGGHFKPFAIGNTLLRACLPHNCVLPLRSPCFQLLPSKVISSVGVYLRSFMPLLAFIDVSNRERRHFRRPK